MDLLSKYKKSGSPSAAPRQYDPIPYVANIGQSSAVIQWIMKHGASRPQAVALIFGFALLAGGVCFFFLFYAQTRVLAPEEEQMFRGKSAPEKLRVPQQIDQSLFNQQ